MFQVTQRNGRRFSAADAYLRPALTRPNLEVRTNVTVLGVELEGDRAVGVRLGRGRGGDRGRARRARGAARAPGRSARRSCCCSRASARREELRAAGVQARHDLPGVGRNLQDHPFVTMLWEVSDQNTLYGADKPEAAGRVGCCAARGKLSSTVAEVGRVHAHARRACRRPDIQFHMGAAYFEDHGAEEYDGHCMVIAPGARLAEGARAGVAALGRPDDQAADHHEHALRARGPRVAARRACALAREIAAQGAAARDRRARS